MQPVQRPEKLPALPAGLDLGQLPSVTDLEVAVAAAFSGRQAPEVNQCHLKHCMDASPGENVHSACINWFSASDQGAWKRQRHNHTYARESAACCVVQVAAFLHDQAETQAWLSQMSCQLAAGEPAVQSALRHYLQCADSPDRYLTCPGAKKWNLNLW